MPDKPHVTLPGKVEKIIKSPFPQEPEKAQVSVEGADHLYKEIRVENKLKDENGKEVKLKPGAEVEVTIEAHSQAVEPKHDSNKQASDKKDSSDSRTSKDSHKK
jgi:hypothetical protein